jgi:hypothetical protein
MILGEFVCKRPHPNRLPRCVRGGKTGEFCKVMRYEQKSVRLGL